MQVVKFLIPEEMRIGQQISNFIRYVEEEHEELFYISDDKFNQLYYEFLCQQK